MIMNYCYIQIYTIDKNIITLEGLKKITDWNILITPNEEYIKKKINFDNLSSSIKNINIIDTFRISFDKLFNVFNHSKNVILNGYIKNGKLIIIEDHNIILLELELPILYEVEMTNITLKATNDFLNKHGLPTF